MGLRDISQPTNRNLSDDNDEFRDLSQYGGLGYPYTYPFYYDEYVRARDLSDPEG